MVHVHDHLGTLGWMILAQNFDTACRPTACQFSQCGCRLQSRGLESLTPGLQSLWLASRLKPCLSSIDGLGWLMAASHGLRVQTRKLTAAN